MADNKQKAVDKARELVDSFMPYVNKRIVDNYYEDVTYTISEKEQLKNAKQCAIILVDSYIEEYGSLPMITGMTTKYVFWQEVKSILLTEY